MSVWYAGCSAADKEDCRKSLTAHNILWSWLSSHAANIIKDFTHPSHPLIELLNLWQMLQFNQSTHIQIK